MDTRSDEQHMTEEVEILLMACVEGVNYFKLRRVY